jgi:hypothetical protein
MNFTAALDETRARDQGKSTIFYNGNIQINSQRIGIFKKRRKQSGEVVGASASGKERMIIWNS